ncbi:hypothetical protein ACFQX7_38935 [Luedemannella flava]
MVSLVTWATRAGAEGVSNDFFTNSCWDFLCRTEFRRGEFKVVLSFDRTPDYNYVPSSPDNVLFTARAYVTTL